MRPALLHGITRRQFLYYSALAASATTLTGCSAPRPRRLSATDKLNIGVIGAGGKGASDTECCAGENIVALCDVDERATAARRAKYPNAKIYQDWRKMLDQEKSLDAVVVSTPDHTHAIAAATAMRLGKHVYCQKPLTQTIYEARLLRKLAKQCNVRTQMGNQGSAEDGLRRTVEIIQAGLIGPVREVHVWTNRPIWPQGMDQPPGSDPVPDRLDWDGWLGPAPLRPYKAEWPEKPMSGGRRRRGSIYHPFAWRGWQDFGTGALGDMACHTANMPFRALNLGYPTEVEATSSAINRESYPLKSTIRFQFPSRGDQPPVTFWWYDGGDPKPDHPYDHDGSNKPPMEVVADVQEMMDKIPGSGCLLVGDNGKLFSPDDYGAQFFLKLKGEKELTDGKTHQAVKNIPQTIPRNPFQGTADQRHHLEWIAACKGGPPGYSDFEIAAYLTEIILLGCVALRAGRKIEWDGPNMLAKNAPEAAQFIRRKPRKGWDF
ncbi:MAG TPA: Gfo/Idh/MocA family oxidoreductase [Candidatus Paceibacterota bacterium]|nr:Gfo/Idh/MocA family oxidoreductase [Verrucomicrobiota bacterium]HSA11311.1 Gfo/Idh/MocA family oxidoreductase [Candidatus Paceibacterota bacterium]